MEQNEVKQQSANQAAAGHDVAAITPAQEYVAMPPSAEEAPCPTCAGGAASMPISYVLAFGHIEARFSRLDVEKEFAQVVGRSGTAGKTDQEVLHAILSKRENRYLARQMCWVLTIQGLETYILQPRDPVDFELLVEAIRPAHSPNDLNMVVGIKGPIVPPGLCNGLVVPMLAYSRISSFRHEEFIKAIPRPEKMAEKQFEAAAAEVFDRIMQMTDNAGATDEHRAVNHLVTYPAIFTKATEEFAQNFSLTGVEVRPSPLSGTRNVVEVIFAYTDRKTDFTEKFCVRVDVTEEFPFLVTKLLPYYDR